MRKSRFTVEQIVGVSKDVEAGVPLTCSPKTGAAKNGWFFITTSAPAAKLNFSIGQTGAHRSAANRLRSELEAKLYPHQNRKEGSGCFSDRHQHRFFEMFDVEVEHVSDDVCGIRVESCREGFRRRSRSVG